MESITFKPELRTHGGESTGIYAGKDWVGDLLMLYREGDLLTGTVQIDTGRIRDGETEPILEQVNTYISHLSAALGVKQTNVSLIYGDIESVLEGDPSGVDLDGTYNPEYDYEEDDAIYTSESEDETHVDTFDSYGLRLASKEGNHSKYHLVDEREHVIGLVSVDERPAHISGRVDFWVEPDSHEPDDVAKVLVNKFGDLDSKLLSFTMTYDDQHLGDIHVEQHDQ